MSVAELGRAEMMPLAKITPYPTNPRKITDKAVQQTAASIKAFGWQQPIVVDGDLVVIIGHVRRLAGLSLGEQEAPVIIETRLSPEQVKALRIADNRASDYTTSGLRPPGRGAGGHGRVRPGARPGRLGGDRGGIPAGRR